MLVLSPIHCEKDNTSVTKEPKISVNDEPKISESDELNIRLVHDEPIVEGLKNNESNYFITKDDIPEAKNGEPKISVNDEPEISESDERIIRLIHNIRVVPDEPIVEELKNNESNHFTTKDDIPEKNPEAKSGLTEEETKQMQGMQLSIDEDTVFTYSNKEKLAELIAANMPEGASEITSPEILVKIYYDVMSEGKTVEHGDSLTKKLTLENLAKGTDEMNEAVGFMMLRYYIEYYFPIDGPWTEEKILDFEPWMIVQFSDEHEEYVQKKIMDMMSRQAFADPNVQKSMFESAETSKSQAEKDWEALENEVKSEYEDISAKVNPIDDTYSEAELASLSENVVDDDDDEDDEDDDDDDDHDAHTHAENRVTPCSSPESYAYCTASGGLPCWLIRLRTFRRKA